MEKSTCLSGCRHHISDREIKMLFPEPDYNHIKFLPAPQGIELQEQEEHFQPIGEGHYIAALNADIPYAFTIGAVTFAGVLYIRGKNTYTDGAFGGVVIGIYHIDKHNTHIRLDGIGVRAHLLIDFQKKHAVAWIETLGVECCGYRNWGKCDVWNTSDQVIIGSW